MINATCRFLQRLRCNVAGNTLAIVGAALVPITAMIGSGVDVSRAYMAKSRLQSACDAASLAARRVMRNDALTDEVVDTGRQFFDFNFQPGMYQTASFEPVVSRPETGLIRIDASTRIPTSIMRLFGFDSLPLNVSCEASLNFVNTDVVLVLDVTGSMLCTPSESSNCGRSSEISTSRIAALRSAVMALYDELAPVQEQLESQGLRLRYSVVPFSSTVNVGHLIRAVDPNYITASTPYQTRVANYSSTPSHISTDTPITSAQAGLLVNPGTHRFRDGGVDRQISNTNCAAFGNNTSFSQSGTSPVGGTFAATGISGDADIYVPAGSSIPQADAPAAPTGYTRYQFTRQTSNWSWGDRVCDRTVTITRRTYQTGYAFSHWTYRQQSLDTNSFRNGSSTTLANNAPQHLSTPGGSYNLQQLASAGATSTTSAIWNGCIEERETVRTITSSGLTIPSGAYDLDIDLVPDNDATRWRPMMREAIFTRAAGSASQTTGSSLNSSAAYWACPSQARRLEEMGRDDMLSYVNSLIAVGGTYHDIGMIWGARLISTGGIFADGCEEYNGMPCNRHIIYMTDGQQTAYCNVYSAYGVERNDGRVRGGTDCTSDTYVNDIPSSSATADLLARHKQRFQMACNATKNMNVSVWVIAFATGLSPEMVNCASNASQASTSGTSDDLIARFRQIGNQIGALRLTR